ncbi:MAG: cysteine peptidase family C39 domain-containing protein [Nostoc sp.]
MKYQIALQPTEEDCSAACLATIAKHYGRTFALNRVREAVGTLSNGHWTAFFSISLYNQDLRNWHKERARLRPATQYFKSDQTHTNVWTF